MVGVVVDKTGAAVLVARSVTVVLISGIDAAVVVVIDSGWFSLSVSEYLIIMFNVFSTLPFREGDFCKIWK